MGNYAVCWKQHSGVPQLLVFSRYHFLQIPKCFGYLVRRGICCRGVKSAFVRRVQGGGGVHIPHPVLLCLALGIGDRSENHRRTVVEHSGEEPILASRSVQSALLTKVFILSYG